MTQDTSQNCCNSPHSCNKLARAVAIWQQSASFIKKAEKSLRHQYRSLAAINSEIEAAARRVTEKFPHISLSLTEDLTFDEGFATLTLTLEAYSDTCRFQKSFKHSCPVLPHGSTSSSTSSTSNRRELKQEFESDRNSLIQYSGSIKTYLSRYAKGSAFLFETEDDPDAIQLEEHQKSVPKKYSKQGEEFSFDIE